MKKSILFIFGTRPEAIKLAPVVQSLRAQPDRFDARVCVTAQHRHMLDQVLAAFELSADFDLNLMQPGQSLTSLTARALAGLEPVIDNLRPDVIVVQGDTTSTFCGALAAFYAHVPVAHVEAGLRTGDLAQPFPEELNRVLTARMTHWHFAATEPARQNLLREGVANEDITVTGNTSIDAILSVQEALRTGRLSATLPPLDPSRKLIVVTAHRRESFGPGMEEIVSALCQLSERPDVQIVFPVHPNPHVRAAVEPLRKRAAVTLLDPLDYVPFVALMDRAYLLLSDSGGVQEEAPSLGKPVLVMREKTERPEGIEAGAAKLVGTDRSVIVREAITLLDDSEAYSAMARVRNIYGDGQASGRIAAVLGAEAIRKATP